MLGGKDNFSVDREAADRLLAAVPHFAGVVRDNRSFIGRAVRYLAGEAGVRQFLDLGAGLPTRSCVHEMAQAIAPDALVVYVDNDPVVCAHGRALLRPDDGIAVVEGDLREPAVILQHPEVTSLLDFRKPVAVLCAAVLHFVPDEEKPHEIMAAYRDHLAPGSHLVITHGPSGTREEDPSGYIESVTNVYRQASANLHVRSLPEIERFFDGFELVDPGVVWMTDWRPDPSILPGAGRSLRAGVGRKPAS